MVEDRSFGSRLFSAVNYALLTLFGLLTFLPFVHVVAGSFTTTAELARKKFVLIPTEYSIDAYRFIFSTNTLPRAMLVSVGVTLFGTLTSMFFSCLMAYGLSRRDLDGRRIILFLVVFTLLFNGGLIPSFLVVRYLGLIDTYASLVLPVAINAFNLIILKNFFQNIPEGLEESAKIDGCNDFGVLFRIVLPLSMPVIATVSLFYAVTYWNTYQNAIFFLNDPKKWPIQVWLRQIVLLASGFNYDESLDNTVPPPEQSIKMAVIVVTTLPMLIVYPILQKHFVKGALLGSIKG